MVRLDSKHELCGKFRVGATAALAIIVATAIGCAAPIHTTTMTAPTASFAQRRTWAWAASPGGAASTSVAGQYIQQAVAQQLASKGYQTAGGAPSFLVDYRVVLRPESSLEGFGGGWGGGSLQTVHYTKGMLLVAATDPATGNALWQGMASTVIDPNSVQADSVARINEAVAKMFETFPPA